MTLALRTPLAVFATGLLALSLHVGAFAFLIEREVFTSENFVASTVAALGEESSRDAMGKLIVDQLIDEYPLLIILESNLVPMFSDLLGTPALREVIALVGIDIHERIELRLTGAGLEARPRCPHPVSPTSPKWDSQKWRNSAVSRRRAACPTPSANKPGGPKAGLRAYWSLRVR